MKISTRIKLAVISALLAAMFITGSAWAAVFCFGHETRASLVNGKAYYSGKYAPVFFGNRSFILDETSRLGEGKFTISIPASETLGWITQIDMYYDNKENEKTFQGSKEFKIEESGDGYSIVDKEHEDVDIYHDDRMYLTVNAEEVIPKSTFSAIIGNKEFFKDEPYPVLRTTGQQIDAKCVPYIELVTSGGKVTGFKWRFVDPAKPEVPLTRGATGTNSCVASILDIAILTKTFPHLHEDDLAIFPKEGDPLAGTRGLIEGESYSLDEVSGVSISYVYDKDVNDLGDEDSTIAFYTWRFDLKDDEADTEDDEEIVIDNGTFKGKGIEVVARHEALKNFTTSDGKARSADVAKADVDPKTIKTMPVFEVSVVNGTVARMSCSVNNLNTIADRGYKVKDLTLVKVKKGGEVAEFERVDNYKDIEDGQFAVTTGAGASLNSGSAIERDKHYTFHFGIKDDGKFDWDSETAGNIVDPAAVAAKLKSDNDNQNGNSNNNNTDNSGGGGCNAGFGMSGLLFVVLAVLKHRTI